MTTIPRIFIGCPTHDDRMSVGTAKAIWSNASKLPFERYADTCNFSLTPTTCNALLCECLNLQAEYNFELFALIHSDVVPPKYWLDTLYAEMVAHDADFVSACIAIKNEIGLISTAIASAADDLDPFTRLTVAQVRHPSFPQTFDIHAAVDALADLPEDMRIDNAPRRALLCNTGLCLLRIKRLNPQRCFFNDPSTIRRNAAGIWQPRTEPEDWYFSRKLQDDGLKVIATTALDVIHTGIAQWGTTDATNGVRRDPARYP